MNWEIHKLSNSLGHFKNDWDKLNAEVYGSNPYGDGSFIDNLLKYFGGGQEQICVHKSNGIIDGMLIIKPDAWGTWSLFLPMQTQIGCLLLKDARILHRLFTKFSGFSHSLICLCQDTLYNPWLSAEDELPLIFVDHCLTIGIDLNSSFEDYWNSRARKLRQNIGRYLRRIQDAGLSIRLDYTDKAADIPAAVERYGEIESAGWKGKEGTAVHIDNIQGMFYRDLLTDFARREKASVYELYIGNKLVASRLCIFSDTMLVMLKTAYNESFSEYAPGRIMLYALLEREFNLGRFNQIEFYTHATSDQLAWATSERMIKHVRVFRNKYLMTAYLGTRHILTYFRSIRISQ